LTVISPARTAPLSAAQRGVDPVQRRRAHRPAQHGLVADDRGEHRLHVAGRQSGEWDGPQVRDQVAAHVRRVAPGSGARSGAGKTTLLRTLLGHLPATGGTVHFRGRDVTSTAPAKLASLGIGYMPQDQPVFPSLTVEENLLLSLQLVPKRARGSLDEALTLFPRLAERRNQRAGTMSGGERKMLGLARVLARGPRLLVLDEPTEGVCHAVIEEMQAALREYAAANAVLLVEQHLEFALNLAHQTLVIERGEVVMRGTAEQVRTDPNFIGYLTPSA
jgi:branched-chain amino acid transport system ATP-binding protein